MQWIIYDSKKVLEIILYKNGAYSSKLSQLCLSIANWSNLCNVPKIGNSQNVNKGKVRLIVNDVKEMLSLSYL